MATAKTTHECHASGCQLQVPTNQLMCKTHWMKVPEPLRKEIWALYKRCLNRQLSLEERQETHIKYRMASDAAAKAVTERDAR